MTQVRSNRYQALIDDVDGGRRILIDGATGTEIELRGVAPLDGAWSSTGALDGPDIVGQIHRDYLRAGARVIISNTFSTSRHALADGGIEDQFESLNRQGIELARRARDAEAPDAVVAAGLTHWSWTRRFPPLGQLADNAVAQAKIMAEAGAEMFILEMMNDVDRMLALLDATAQTGLPTWVGFSTEAVAGDGEPVRLVEGPPLTEGVAALAGHDVPVVFIMHTEVADVDPALDVLDQVWKGPVGVYAHSGHFVQPNWIFNGVISPEDYATASRRWLDRGVQVIGGCCGIGPDHIEHLVPLV